MIVGQGSVGLRFLRGAWMDKWIFIHDMIYF